MRSTLSMAVCLFAGGCVSSWTGPEFDSQFASRPHWPDCDGDGWGDPTVAPACINPENEPPPDCGASTGSWMANGFDCDDAYDTSGSRVGPACPDDFAAYVGGSLTSDDYTVLVAGGREFLLWRERPITAQAAVLMCQEWAAPYGEPVDLPDDVPVSEVDAWAGTRDPAPEDPAAVVPLVGMPENGQQLSPIVDQVTQDWGLDVWRGWVDVTWNGTEWDFVGPVVNPVPLSFCPSEQRLDVDDPADGIQPDEVYEGLIPGAESDEFLEEIYSEMRLVLRIERDLLPCLEAPVSTCVDGEPCVPSANLICERPLQAPQSRVLFEVGDLECIQQG